MCFLAMLQWVEHALHEACLRYWLWDIKYFASTPDNLDWGQSLDPVQNILSHHHEFMTDMLRHPMQMHWGSVEIVDIKKNP